MKKRADKNIKTVSLENIDKDFNDIKIIDVGDNNKREKVFGIAFTLIVTVLLLIAAIGTVYITTSTKIIQGNVDGSMFSAAGISVVKKDYSPTDYLKQGSRIYYDTKGSNNDFFTDSSKFTVGVVKSVDQKKVVLESDDVLRDHTINLSQINYVLKD